MRSKRSRLPRCIFHGFFYVQRAFRPNLKRMTESVRCWRAQNVLVTKRCETVRESARNALLDYESPALTAELQARLPTKIDGAACLHRSCVSVTLPALS